MDVTFRWMLKKRLVAMATMVFFLLINTGTINGFQMGNIKKIEKYDTFHLPQKHKLGLNQANTKSTTQSSTHGFITLTHMEAISPNTVQKQVGDDTELSKENQYAFTPASTSEERAPKHGIQSISYNDNVSSHESTDMTEQDNISNKISDQQAKVNLQLPLENTEVINSFPQLKPFLVSKKKSEKWNKKLKYKLITEALGKFSSSLYSELTTNDLIKPEKKDTNIAYSPICIHLMLALIMLGSHGKTKTEMLKILQIKDKVDHVNIFMAYKDLISSLDEEGEFNSKECIKGTFIDPSLGSIAQNYINTADKYGSRIYPLDFTKGEKVVKKRIDGWINQQTNGSIAHITNKEMSDSDPYPHMDVYTASVFTPVVLPIFNNKRMVEKIWKADLGKIGIVDVKIPMMESKVQEIRVIESKEFGCFVLELPAARPNSSMILFLQHKSSIRKVEEIFVRRPDNGPSPRVQSPSISALDKIIEQLEKTPKTKHVKVFMPSFSVVDSSELTDVLVTLGANDLLDSKRAELTGIIKLNDDINNRLSLKNFIYKTRVDITGMNEYIPKTNVTGIVEFQNTITVDRPFFFVLRNTRYNINKIVGKIVNPSVITSSNMPQSKNSTEQDYVEPSADVNILNQVKIHNNLLESNLGDLENPKNVPQSRKDISNLNNVWDTNTNSFRPERRLANQKSDFKQERALKSKVPLSIETLQDEEKVSKVKDLDMLVKQLDKEIFIKNKEKRDSMVRPADFLLPRLGSRYSSGNKSIESRIHQAANRIKLIQNIANESLPEEETTTPEITTTLSLDNSTNISIQQQFFRNKI